MTNLYLNFNTINTNQEQDIKAQCKANFNHSFNEFDKINIVKGYISCSNIHFMTIPLSENQTVVIGKQNNGYYKTVYNIKFYYNLNVETTLPIYFKNYERTDIPDIASITHSDNTKTYDNYNDYFKIKNLNTLLKCINETLHDHLMSTLSILPDSNYVKIFPSFYTENNILYCDNISSYDNTTNIKQNYDPTNNVNGVFCFGLSKNIGKYIYNGLLNKEHNKYIFLQEGMINELKKINFTNDYLHISSYKNVDYYEYMHDIKKIFIRGNIPVIPLYYQIQEKKFVLNPPVLKYDVLNGVLWSFNIDHDRDNLSSLSFSNSDLNGNFSTLLPFKMDLFNLEIIYLDKYGNDYQLFLSYGESIDIMVKLSKN